MSQTTGLPADHEQRRRIVEELDVTLLVEAAAGTGKTTSMVERMVALLAQGRCRIETLAAVTFTRKAAAELRSRFQVALEQAARQADGEPASRLAEAAEHVERCFVGTIHSFCGRLLRERPVEAGVDPAFRELEPDADRRLREQAWTDAVNRLFARDDPLLAELHELGLEVAQLREAFLRFADFPDVDEWPAPSVELPDLGPAVQELQEYVGHMEELVPDFPVRRGNDKLMNTYERIVRLVRHRDLDRPAELFEVLEAFDAKPAVTQKEWPGGRPQGRAERDRWEDFRDRLATPLVQRWREKRYGPVLQLLQHVRPRYDRLREESGGLNYQDLLLRASALLRNRPAIRDYFRRRFTHLLVDEFQDTDPVQAEVMMYVTAGDPSEADWRRCRPVPGSLFVVGDPKQSIYRFRRADIVTYNRVKWMIEDSGGAVVPLTTNFRSRPDLVEWTNGVFENEFPSRADDYSPAAAAMQAGCAGEADGDLHGVRVLSVPAAYSRKQAIIDYEADYLARFIRHALDAGLTVPRTPKERERGLGSEVVPGDVLIVTRNKAQLAVYARKLQELEIPHQVTGGRALDQVEELKLLVDCLRAVAEPENPVALVSVLRGGLFGTSDESLYAYRRSGGTFSFRARVPEELEEHHAAAFRDAFGRLRRYAGWFRSLPPVAALERTAADLGLPALAAAGPGGEVQAGSIGKAVEMLRTAQPELHSVEDLAAYLEDLIERNAEFDGLPVRPHAEPAVRLMNLHKAKGLEAPLVFLADPTGKTDHPIELHVDRSGPTVRGYLVVHGPRRGRFGPRPVLARPVGWDRLDQEERRFQDAEETRLLYVAATRAGAQLTVTVPENAGAHSRSYWSPLSAYLDGPEPLEDPGPQTAPDPERVAVNEEDVVTASQEIADRWESVGSPRYATVAAKDFSITASGRHRPRTGGEHGTEWGTVIHYLLDVKLREPGADLGPLASSALEEEELDPALADEVVRTVETVMNSEVWSRARASPKALTEVPFVCRMPADPSDDGLPTVVRGTIDLVFREGGEWVIVDYKTDAAASGGVEPLVEHYRPQVELYAGCWRSIVGEPVREAGLFFTAVPGYVEVLQ